MAAQNEATLKAHEELLLQEVKLREEIDAFRVRR